MLSLSGVSSIQRFLVSVNKFVQHVLVYHRIADSDLEILSLIWFLLLNIRKQADSAPLMTRAMREVREESEMYKYDKVGT